MPTLLFSNSKIKTKECCKYLGKRERKKITEIKTKKKNKKKQIMR